MKKEKEEILVQLGKAVRRDVLRLCEQSKSGHVGSAFSVIEILLVLYTNVIKGRYPDPNRDRVILGKGHAGNALISTLIRLGRMDECARDMFGVNGSRLGHHPHYEPSLGFEANTGSLGHGLSVGAGTAYAACKQNSSARTFVILSDGDINEGATWEAAAFASHHKLSNLCMIHDANKLQALGFTRDILCSAEPGERWRAFGWDSITVDGHNVNELDDALLRMGFSEKPLAIIANTIKGKGVSFMENNLLWHYRVPSGEEYLKALEELSI